MVTLQLRDPLFSDAVLQRRLIGFLTIHNLCIRATWNLSVRDSVVYLRGRVSDPRSLARLEASCRRVAGVIGIDSSAVAIGPASIEPMSVGPRQPHRTWSSPARNVQEGGSTMFEQLSVELLECAAT